MIDACTLLTDQEAAQVVGAAVTHSESNNPGTRACQYKTGTGAASTGFALPTGGFLSISVNVSPSPAAARAALVTQSQGFVVPGHPNPEIMLPNLGDGGFVLVAAPGLGVISATKGVAFLTIEVDNVSTTQAALEAAAQSALARL